MLFKSWHIPQIRAGEKTVTRREWSENYAGASIGTVVAATTELFVPDEDADCYIRITDRYREPLGEMTDADARKEGDYEDLDAFRDGYERVYGAGAWDPAKVVDVVAFEYVGRKRPGDDEDAETLAADGGIPTELPAEVETLREAAQEYWGDDRWAIDVKLWTDGTTSTYAYRSKGRADEGLLVQERLFATADGEVYAERVELEQREVGSEELGRVGDANK
jgi:uncharacterized protein YhfF